MLPSALVKGGGLLQDDDDDDEDMELEQIRELALRRRMALEA